MSDDPAVQAAAWALHRLEMPGFGKPTGNCNGHCASQAEIAVEAARPIIVEQVAASLDADEFYWQAADLVRMRFGLTFRAAVRTEPEQ